MKIPKISKYPKVLNSKFSKIIKSKIFKIKFKILENCEILNFQKL